LYMDTSCYASRCPFFAHSVSRGKAAVNLPWG
jgi:hypothetical protein